MADDPDLETWALRGLGHRLRDARIEANLTLPEAAERAGIGSPYLSELERGHKLPKLLTLVKIAAAYDLLAVDLLQGMYPFGVRRRPRRLPAPPGDARQGPVRPSGSPLSDRP